jgi:hypothetical protein
VSPNPALLARSSASLGSPSTLPSVRPFIPLTQRFPAIATRSTVRRSPGSNRTAVPAGMSSRVPKAASRSNSRAALASKK